MAIDLDKIYEIESSSGKNKAAYKQNSAGALGGFQLTPNAILDIQRVYPKKWGKMSFKEIALDDTLSRQAANDYFNVLQSYYTTWKVPVTPETLLIGYNAGPGNARKYSQGKYKLSPETAGYIAKYNKR